MSDIATTYRPELDETCEKLVSSVPTSTETLITEQQVLFNTAAATALPAARSRGWSDTVRAVAASFSGWLAAAVQPPKPVYPKRHVWLETALLSREMDRL